MVISTVLWGVSKLVGSASQCGDSDLEVSRTADNAESICNTCTEFRNTPNAHSCPIRGASGMKELYIRDFGSHHREGALPANFATPPENDGCPTHDL